MNEYVCGPTLLANDKFNLTGEFNAVYSIIGSRFHRVWLDDGNVRN